MTNENITLSKTERADLDPLFLIQLDKEANFMAAFTAKDSTNRAAFIEKYTRFLTDPTIRMLTIRTDEEIVGSVARFVVDNRAEITYWIARKYWGRGIAAAALKNLLELEPGRPVYGRVAFDNYGSQRVLEKCGFVKIGTDKGFANARQTEIEEYIYQLAT